MLYAQAIQRYSPQDQIKLTNSVLRASIPRKSFITMLVAVLDGRDRSVTLSNAGHCYPVVYRSGEHRAETLEVRGMPLNFADALMVQERKIPMEPGDILVLYSDGVNEAQNGIQELFGLDRLRTVIEAGGEQPPPTLLQNILDEIRLFSKGVPQSDDITVLILKASG